MKLCAIAFSVDWFLTIPGILISCGVLLLIIALIMFVAGSLKSKKKVNKENVDAPNKVVDEVKDNVVSLQSNVEMEKPKMVIPNEEVVTSEPMGPITEGSMPVNVVPDVAEIVNPIPEIPVVENAISVENVPSVEEVVPIPVVNEVTIPEIKVDAIPTETIPVQEPVSMEPVLENADIALQNLEKTSVNIYGGVAPVVLPVKEEVRPIYGGADPLDATQNLPKMDVHHEPYSGGREVVEQPIPVVSPVLFNETEDITMPVVDEFVSEHQVMDSPVPEVVKIPDTLDVEQL